MKNTSFTHAPLPSHPADGGSKKAMCIIAERMPEKHLIWLAVLLRLSGGAFVAGIYRVISLLLTGS